MKKFALLAVLLLFTFSPMTAVAGEESIDFTIYQYIDPEDIPDDIPGSKIIVYVEESFSNDDLYDIRNKMIGRSYDWRTQLPLETSPIYAEDQNMSLRMYFDLMEDVFALANVVEDRAKLYEIEKWGSFLSPNSYAWFQNHLAYFQTVIPVIQEELEYAQKYSRFVKELTEEQSRKLFGPMLTRELDAEQTIHKTEIALKQLEYLKRLQLQYIEYPDPEGISSDQLQDAVNRHGFSEDEIMQENEIALPNGTDSSESQNDGGIPWGRMLGWTIFGSVFGFLGKKTFDRLRTVMAKKFLETLKNATPEERKMMIKDYQKGTKARSSVNTGAVKTAEKISPFAKAARFFSEKIGRRVPVAATVYTAYDTYDTLTDPEMEQKEKWKKTTAAVWKGAWAVVGSGVGTLAGPGYGSVIGGFVGYTFGELTSSWAEKAGENLFNLFH